ncbi:MAG: hypothetical protein RR506_09355, partial [Akkermansia sp.]
FVPQRSTLQPTRPVGGALTIRISPQWPKEFQSTRPVGGATAESESSNPKFSLTLISPIVNN